MPLTEICNAIYSDPRQRQLFKNIIYVGALSVLLEIDPEVIEKLFGEQYKGKEKLLDSNVQALHLGRDFAREHLQAPLGIRVRRADQVGDRIFVDGNSAAALGCVYGGATVAPGIRSRLRRRWPRPSRSTAASSASIRPPARTATPSCRPRTRSPRSAWWSAPAGTARAPSPPPRDRACR